MVKELASRMHSEGKEAVWDKLDEVNTTWQKTYEEVFAAGMENTGRVNRKSTGKAGKSEWATDLWRRFLALDTDEVRALLLRRKQVYASGGTRDEALFIATAWYKVFSGHAPEAYADMTRELFSRSEVCSTKRI